MNLLKKTILTIILTFFIHTIFSQTTIFMEKENGVYQIPCKVNGIPMKFIFDTGASDVTISLTEAQFLIKQNLLSVNDIIGKEKYQIANGDIEVGTKIILKEINIRGLVLHNIEASVIHSQQAPLLLGQNVISKLGKLELEGNRLTIYPLKKNNYDEFIGINLTKKFSEFNDELSPYLSLKDGKEDVELTPIPFEALNIIEHKLKEYQFDKKVIVFSTNEKVQIVLLFKETKDGGKEILKNLIDEFTQIYSIPNFKDNRSAEWKFEDYELNVSLDTSNNITVAYLKSVPNVYPEKKNSRYSDLDLTERRQLFVDGLNEIYMDGNPANYKVIYRFSKSEFQIIIERNMEEGYPKSFSKYNKSELEEIENYEKDHLETFARIFFNPNENEFLIDNEYETVKIFGEYYYKGASVRKAQIEFKVDDFYKLQYPYTESEFHNIIQ